MHSYSVHATRDMYMAVLAFEGTTHVYGYNLGEKSRYWIADYLLVFSGDHGGGSL